MLLYSPAGHSVKDVALDSGKTTFDQERIIQEFIQKKSNNENWHRKYSIEGLVFKRLPQK